MAVTKTKESPTPATPETFAPGPDVVDTASSTGPDHHRTVDAWFVRCFHNCGVSHHTELISMLHFATQKLHQQLGLSEARSVSSVVEYWLHTKFEAVRQYVPGGLDHIMSNAKQELMKLFGIERGD